MTIKITILGCGSSLGVPMIGCTCQVCQSDSSYNKRLRSSLLIENKGKNILVDFGYDMRTQLLRENIGKLDSAILTHAHADHLSSIDDMRPFHMVYKLPPVEIYMSKTTYLLFKERFPYLNNAKYFKVNLIGEYEKIAINQINFQFFNQDHGTIDSAGFRIGNFAYANDLISFYKTSEQYLYNLDILIADCMSFKTSPTHAGLDRVLEWDKKFSPKKIYLTNMNHSIDYFEIQKSLPVHIKPLYDRQFFYI